MQQILIIEDDRALNQGLCKALKTDNSSIQVSSGLYAFETDRQIVSCENLKDAKEQMLCGMPSLILLDINLPDGSGLDFLQSVKMECPECPVILLTANDTDGDIVNGLELGADDYITKPFSLSVLRARVNTQLRKAAAMSEKEKDKEPYVFDFDRMKFMVDGKETELSKTEQKLLRILVENAGMNMRRELLLDRVWSDGAEYVDENALSVSIKRLRDKLGAEHAIRTVYGIGDSYCNYYFCKLQTHKENNGYDRRNAECGSQGRIYRGTIRRDTHVGFGDKICPLLKCICSVRTKCRGRERQNKSIDCRHFPSDKNADRKSSLI